MAHTIPASHVELEHWLGPQGQSRDERTLSDMVAESAHFLRDYQLKYRHFLDLKSDGASNALDKIICVNQTE